MCVWGGGGGRGAANTTCKVHKGSDFKNAPDLTLRPQPKSKSERKKGEKYRRERKRGN